MKRRYLGVMVAAVMVVGLHGGAGAAVSDPGPAPGSDDHEFEFTGEYPSTVKGSYVRKAGKFKGTLSSSFEDSDGILEDSDDEDRICVVGRKVEVFKNNAKKADQSVGTAKVDENGNWSVNASGVRRGSYYAKVKEDEYLVRTYYGVNEYAICGKDKSREIRP